MYEFCSALKFTPLPQLSVMGTAHECKIFKMTRMKNKKTPVLKSQIDTTKEYNCRKYCRNAFRILLTRKNLSSKISFLQWQFSRPDNPELTEDTLVLKLNGGNSRNKVGKTFNCQKKK
ncbi:unnamed protein product [Ixodes persulcatus]